MSMKRNLPDWMVACDNKRGKDEHMRETPKRKPEVNTSKKRVGKKCIKRMIYWMNERELVETALGIIKSDNAEPAVGNRCAPQDTETTSIPETDPEDTTDSDASERDVDITEQETVPYSDASESSSERCLTTTVGLEEKTESEDNKPQSDPDHEALQVLRDIFFS